MLAKLAKTVQGSGTAPGLLLAVAMSLVALVLAELAPVPSPLIAAVAVGCVVGNLGVSEGAQFRPGLSFAGRTLLRVGVVLLGFQLVARDLLALGMPGLLAVVTLVLVTFVGTRLMARLLGVPSRLALLIAAGFSICGASAIAAVAAADDSDEDSVAYGVGLVTVCGTAAMVLLPLLRVPLGLTPFEFGRWAGASIHDVAQVVAASSALGAKTLYAALVVKLTRILLLLPIVAWVAASKSGSASRRGAKVPLFVVVFAAAPIIRSTGVLPTFALSSLKVAATGCLAVALCALGTGIRARHFREVGGRPLLLGLFATALIATAGLVVVKVI